MTWQKISLKFPGICMECKKQIKEGVEDWWEKGSGIKHDLCHSGGTVYKYVNADEITNNDLDDIGIENITDEEKERAKNAREFLKDS